MVAKKMTKNMSALIESLNDMVAEFLEGQKDGKGKVKVDSAIEEFKGEETQAKLAEIVKTHMKEKRVKALKDPQAPKKAKCGYNFFCIEMRPRVVEDHPDFKQTQVMSELGRMWKEEYPSDDDRKKWMKMAKKDKARFESENENYERPSDEELAGLKENRGRTRAPKGEGKTAKKKRDKALPKGKKSAYMFFAQANREQVKEDNPNMSGSDVTKELATMWKEIKDNKKKAKKYVQQAEEDKERYDEEMKKYKEEHPEAESPKKGKKGKKAKEAESDSESDGEEEKPKAKATESDVDADEEEKPKAKGKKVKIEADETKKSKRKLPEFIPQQAADEDEDLLE